MRMTIEPTEHFFMAGDAMVRAWRGTNDQGQAVIAFVACVSVDEADGRATEGLVSIPPPTPEDAARWADEVQRRARGNNHGM